MTSFKKLNFRIYEKDKSQLTPDVLYWKQLGNPSLVKEFGPIDYIDFSSVEPYLFAVTCSVRVQVYNPTTKLVVKNLSRFRENAYGAVFRSDGRLLCAGSEETYVKLFDVATKSLLRLFKGHSAPVHRAFFREAKPEIASFSDDKSVKIWDIPTETSVLTYSDHSDYIRAGATNALLPDIVLSGGYDNYVRMYDTRSDKQVLSVNHGSPVESLIFLPSGSIFLSAGGTEIKVWDTLAGGKLLGSISQHHKTITCLRLASDNKRLLSGSLDRHVKVYDISTFKVVHTLDYSNGILSLGISKNDEALAVGLVDGLIAVSQKAVEPTVKTTDKKTISHQHAPDFVHPTVDTTVVYKPNDKETKYDKCLRKFEFSKALDAVLLPYVANKTPAITVSVLQELIKRRALEKALFKRNAKFMVQLIHFFIRNVPEARLAKTIINAANIFIDVFRDDPLMALPEVKSSLMILIKLLKEEVEISNELIKLQGAMDMLLSAALTQTESIEFTKHNLIPSKNAEQSIIVNLT